jgi:hypothetical protein
MLLVVLKLVVMVVEVHLDLYVLHDLVVNL